MNKRQSSSVILTFRLIPEFLNFLQIMHDIDDTTGYPYQSLSTESE